MQLSIDSDANEFKRRISPTLANSPIEHAVLLVALEAGTDTSLYLAVIDDAESIVGVGFTKKPGGDLILSVMPTAVAAFMADQLADAGHTFTGIAGSAAAADEFAQRWADHGRQQVITGMRRQIYELGTLVPPTNVPGVPVEFVERHTEQWISWWQAYLAEVYDQASPDPLAELQQRLQQGRLFFWEINGNPVAFGACTHPVDGIARVGPIYTPPEFRGRGFAAALTTHLSQLCRDQGAKHVMLRADIANETSNRVYQRIGYQSRGIMQDYFCG